MRKDILGVTRKRARCILALEQILLCMEQWRGLYCRRAKPERRKYVSFNFGKCIL